MFADTAPEVEELSSHVVLEVSPQGGHVGFVTGRMPFIADCWLEQRIPEWLATMKTDTGAAEKSNG